MHGKELTTKKDYILRSAQAQMGDIGEWEKVPNTQSQITLIRCEVDFLETNDLLDLADFANRFEDILVEVSPRTTGGCCQDLAATMLVTVSRYNGPKEE